MHRPLSSEYAPAYASYVALVPEDEILKVLEKQLAELLTLLRPVSEDQSNLRHPPYSWSVKEVVGHMTDAERIFGYRALRFARGDATPLPGFDENTYAKAGDFDRCRFGELLEEFECVRLSHLWLFRHLPDAAWARTGEASGSAVSVRALAYIMAGHVRHHTAILRRRLGVT